MNSLVFVAALAFVACASAGLVPTAEIIQGPSSRTTLLGSDGSIVDSISPGGIVGRTAPIVAAASPAYSAPLLYSTPIAHSAPVLSSGVVATNSLDTLVAGPSGTIATSKTLAAPAIVAAPSLYAAHGLYL